MPNHQQIAQLQTEIAGLKKAIALLATMPDARRPLEEELSTKERELALLRGEAPPASRSHNQTISGNARVGTAISGDVHGPINVTQQSGGINYGSNNQFGQIGDVVAGDKVMGDKVGGNKVVNQGPQVYGNINSGGDTNLATNQTINNTNLPTEPAADRTPPQVTQSPELRLLLEDTAGTPLSALTVGEEAVLRLELAQADGTPDLDLQLEADGMGVEWLEGTRRPLKIRAGAVARAPKWPLQPEQPGTLTLRVLVLANGQLVQQLALTVQCSEAGASGVLSASPGTAAAEPSIPVVAVGLTLSSVPSLPTHANALTLIFDREREGFSLRLIDGGSATASPIALTDTGLSDLLAEARTRLLAIVWRSEGVKQIFQKPDLTIPSPHAETALVQLAQVGAWLWQALFAGSGDALALSERIRARSQATSLHLTIAAAHLPFPWPLLYDRDPNQPITPDGFWGFRHVLESVPTSGRAGPMCGNLALGSSQNLKALVALNLLIDTKPKKLDPPVIPKQQQALAELGLAFNALTTEPALRDAFRNGSDAELVYLYCHVLNVDPGGAAVRPGVGSAPGVGNTRIVLTEGKNGLTLRDLQLAAPISSTPLLRGGPLVVLNACGSAELSPLTYDGLVPYLLDLGARAVIGTECETPIYFGAEFGLELLRAVVRDRLSVGEALRATRRQFLEKNHNPLGLLYALYGSADLRMVEPKTA